MRDARSLECTDQTQNAHLQIPVRVSQYLGRRWIHRVCASTVNPILSRCKWLLVTRKICAEAQGLDEELGPHNMQVEDLLAVC